MNWTGGSLQRTKNAQRGVLQKQKAHFAKARTHLQNASNSPTAPFRPSYLRNNNNSDLKGRTPSFGTGSIRHTGHTARRRGEQTQRETSPSDRIPVSGDKVRSTNKVVPPHEPHRPAPGTYPARRASKEQRSEKRKAADANQETQLLEANRKRLLRQKDWIGMYPSRPVDLRFLSSKERDEIGKRRKIARKHGATTGERRNVDSLRRKPQRTNTTVAGAFLGGTIHNDLDDIQIRIGTDALTNDYSTRSNGHAKSQASPDLMLFDQEGRDVERARKPGLARPVNPQLQTANSASQQGSAAPYERIPFGEQARHHHRFAQNRKPSSSRDCFEHSSSDSNLLELQAQHTDVARATNKGSESSVSGFRFTYQAGGIERPLRLIFDESNSTTNGRSCIAAQKDNIGTTKHVCGLFSAVESQTGHMRRVYSDNGQSVIDEASATIAIVDEEPWKSFLAISDGGSSHSDTAIRPGNSTLHSYPTVQNNNEIVTNWSQHATQGCQTHISSSTISASLPSLKRGIEQLVSEHPLRANPMVQGSPVGTKSRVIDEDERLWQAFVFGSDDNLSLETMHHHAQASQQEMSKASGEASSRYLPLSVAVSSVSSTPFSSISGLAACMSDNVQDDAAFAPPSGPQGISSPVVHGFVEELSEGKQGNALAERSAFGEQSVTHAFLQDNASGGTHLVSSRPFSHTRTSRSGLDRPDRTLDVTYTADTASRRRLRREVENSSSICDIPVSDDDASDGLDLVDPDRCT